MSGRCCDKHIAKVIQIGGIEVGISGLDEAFRDVYRSGIEDDDLLKNELLLKIKAYGNYVTLSREEIYKETLLKEYRNFQSAVQEAIARRVGQNVVQKKNISFIRIIKMNANKIITAALLILIVGSVAYLLVNELSMKQSVAGSPEENPAASGLTKNDTAESAALSDRQSGTSKIIAYYFHRTMRCATCTMLEQYSDEAIRQGFGDELKTGRLVWKSVNFEEPENRHFEEEYKLHTQSLVLVFMTGGERKGWKNLDKIWELVGAREVFTRYVHEELTDYLAENS